MEIILATYRGDTPLTIANPAAPHKTLRVEPGETIVLPDPSKERLRAWGFDCKTISWEDLTKVISRAKEATPEGKRRRYAEVCPFVFRKSFLAVILGDPPRFSGLLLYFEQILKALSEQGCAVHLLSTKEIELPYSSFDYTHEIAESFNTQFEGFSAIIALTPGNLAPAVRLKTELGCKLILVVSDPPNLIGENLGLPYYEGTDSSEFAAADLFVVPSFTSLTYLNSFLGKSLSNVIIFPPRLDMDEYTGEQKSRCILLCGRMIPYKGVSEVLRELDMIDRDFEVTVISNGKIDKPFKHKVRFLQNISRSRKVREFHRSKVGIVFSKHEGYGMVAGEMLLAGMQVVSSRLSAHEEIYGDALSYVDTSKEAAELAVQLLDREPGRLFDYQPPDTEAIAENIISRISSIRRDRRLVFLTRYWNPPVGGGEITNSRILLEMEKKGWDVLVLYTSKPGFTTQIKLPSFKSCFVRSEAEAYEAALRFSPHLILATTREVPMANRIANRLGIKCVGYFQFWSFIKDGKLRDLDTREYSADDKDFAERHFGGAEIVANSPYTAKVIERATGRKVPHFIPQLDIKPRKPLPYSERSGVIMSILENTDEGWELMRKIAEQLPEIHFDIGFSRSVARPKMPSNVTIYDFLPDFGGKVAQARVALLISTVDHTFGRFPLEAASCGTPVVCSAAGNLKNYGFAKRVANAVSDFVTAIKNLYFDEDEWTRASNAGLEYLANLRMPSAREFSEFLDKRFRVASEVAFVCAGYPGVSRHLRNAAKLLGVDFYTLEEAREFSVPVLAGGWAEAYLRIKAPQIYCLFCSNLLQSELSNEIGLLLRVIELNKAGKIARLFFSDSSMARFANKMGADAAYLPHPLQIPSEEVLHLLQNSVGIFNLIHRRKNGATQIVAAVMEGFDIHLVSSRLRPEIEKLIESLSPRVTRYGWLEDEKYFELMSKMEIGLQVTLSETFNYTGAEMLLRGVPVISTPAPFLRVLAPRRKELVVVDPDSLDSIQDAIARVRKKYSTIEARRDLAEEARRRAREWNESVKNQWRKLLLGEIECRS